MEKPDIPTEDKDKNFRFPYEIMKGPAKRFTEAYGQRLEVPKEFLYITYLTILGVVLARKVTISIEIKPQPRLYVLLLGQSADDRKSTAIEKSCEFWRQALISNFGRTLPECWGVGSAEGLATFIKKMCPEKSLLLCYDEFKSFVSKSQIKSSVLLPAINTLFEKNRLENTVKNGINIITDVHLSFIAASTIDTYEATWSRSFTDIGFNNRLFIVPGTGERKHSLPPMVPLNEIEELIHDVKDIFEFVGDYREIGFTETAREIYDSWYMNRSTSVHAKRLDGYALRFMLLMAVNQRSKVIDDVIVTDACELMDWQLTMRETHDPIDADNQFAMMEQRIRNVLRDRGPLTERELKQYSNATRTGLWIYTSAMQNLRKEREVAINKSDRKWFLAKRSDESDEKE